MNRPALAGAGVASATMSDPPSGPWEPSPGPPPGGQPPPDAPQPWGAPPPPGGWGPGPYPPAGPKTSGLAITSLIAGIAQFVICPVIGGVVAIVTGHVARSRIRQSQGRESGSGMALAGLILGYVGIALTILGVLAAVLVIGVWGDDIARASMRDRAHEFVDEAQREAQITGLPVRNADVLA